MPNNKNTSPFASSFKSAIKRGTPCTMAVENIAKRTKKSPKQIFESLFKAGLCNKQKVAGQWVYWPCEGKKGTATNSKFCQNNMWQWFVDWCICSGFCTPQQLDNHCSSQAEFMNFCKKFFSKQFSPTTGKTKKWNKSTPKSYKFPSVKGRSPKKFRKVA